MNNATDYVCVDCGHKFTYVGMFPPCPNCGDYNCFISTGASTPEPEPIHNELPAVWDLVIADMQERNEFGKKKYGTPLQPFNGRNALKDAYQEVLDLAVYLRQKLYEDENAHETNT